MSFYEQSLLKLSAKVKSVYPLVTIGIPNYNYAHYIVDAMESAVAQSYPNIELLIVDDCSSDNSIDVITNWIKHYKGKAIVKLIQNNSNRGLSGTCNVILNNANGVYYQTLDADDMVTDDKIYRQVAELQANPNSALIYSNAWLIDEAGNQMQQDYLARIHYNEDAMPEGYIFRKLFEFNFIPLPTVLVNTAMARDCGGYDDKLQVQDYYLWLKLSKIHPVLFLKERLAHYRIHKSSMSNNPSTNLKSIESVLKIKYSFIKNVDEAQRKIIKKNIHFSTVLFYEHHFDSASLWLGRDAVLTPGLKSWGYYLAFKIGIPFTFFKKIKLLIFNR